MPSDTQPVTGPKFHILIIHDVEIESPNGTLRWAYANRSLALQECAPADFIVDRMSLGDFDPHTMAARYDLVFCLDYSATYNLYMRWPRGCKTPRVVSFNKDARSHERQWQFTPQYATWTIVNNAHRFTTGGRRPRTCYIPNGVADYWKDCEGSHPLRVLWCGSTSLPKKKNYHSVILPLAELLRARGDEFSFRPIDDIRTGIVFPPDKQREWYWSGDIVLCASSSEGGGPSFLMEGAACGCIPVTTDVGNAFEWAYRIGVCFATDGKPTADKAIEAIDIARATMLDRSRIAAHMQKYRYAGENGIANWFFALFRHLIKHGPDMEPWDWREKDWREI